MRLAGGWQRVSVLVQTVQRSLVYTQPQNPKYFARLVPLVALSRRVKAATALPRLPLDVRFLSAGASRGD